MEASITEILGNVPLFALLDANERTVLAERLDALEVAKGELFFHIGEPGDALYVVTEGCVELFFLSHTGERVVLEKALPGDFFGEMSLLDGGARGASAVALEPTKALKVDRGDLDELFRLAPHAALDMLTATGKRLRETTRLLRQAGSRDINQVEEDNRTTVMKVTDWISEFSGSLTFLFIHIVMFAIWVGLNVQPLRNTSFGGFDPFPFGLLTMAVSLEAIILSVFVLLSQNRQVGRDRVRNDIEYAVTIKAELEVAQLHVRMDELQADMLLRLERIEKSVLTTARLLKNEPGSVGLSE